MLVDQIMTKEVFFCRPDDRMSVAARILRDHDCGSLPVVQEGLGVVGMLTDRDICMAAALQDLPLRDITVSTAMSRNVHTCDRADPVSTAEATMRSKQVRRLPVVDESNQLVGVLSVYDLLQEAERGRAAMPGAVGAFVTKDEVTDTLAAICERRIMAAGTA